MDREERQRALLATGCGPGGGEVLRLRHPEARLRAGALRLLRVGTFCCKCRYSCPNCHAKRLALWDLWLQQTLLAEVPHRQVVLTKCSCSPDREARSAVSGRSGEHMECRLASPGPWTASFRGGILGR